MNVVNAPLTTLLKTAFNKTNTTRCSKSSTSTSSEPTTQQTLTDMGLLSSFSILTSSPSSAFPNTETTKTNSMLHNPNNAMSLSSAQRPASSYELRIKMESVGTQPEQDDDLDMCPARTRAIWPRELIPWWQPTQLHDKPPYSYATLIAYAILISQDGRLLLNDIYQWISETYPYYSLNQRGWQNSIRHNLSLNKKWFLKVDRRPTQANPGKGCYWTLVPGTEEMFMENITQAGGHHRKHHDIGLTAELSRGQCTNSVSRQQQQLNFSTSDDIKKTTLPSPATTKSSKSAAPMYSTFRMTNTTMESIGHCDNHSKKRAKLHHPDDNKSSSWNLPAVDTTSPNKKRSKFNDYSANTQPREYYDTVDDDTQSDCDSGVDVGNDQGGGKVKSNTFLEIPPSELASTNEQVRFYNVLDHFLDQLPLPDSHGQVSLSSNQWDSNGYPSYGCSSSSSHSSSPSFSLSPVTIPSAGAFGFLNSSEMDPVLGYPPMNYYSTNGFFYDNNEQIVSGSNLTAVHPALLTSRLDSACDATTTMNQNVDTSLMVMPTTTTNNTVIHENHGGSLNVGGTQIGDAQRQQQQKDYLSSPEKVETILIHLNSGECNGDEEIANKYLKFEDDDQACVSGSVLSSTGVSIDKSMDGSTSMDTSCFQHDDYLSYPFTTMCGLLES
ncbi:fork head domain-domain-containing protein [Absidia repens]|uniref:Fork head domain-domain-containing protein n=1 Tax=Absidia repens TaxID=90262 RepID=A0A1X2IW53_9FUNG|nr:fork head domain-domain-containing protein [Absidia repens]